MEALGSSFMLVLLLIGILLVLSRRSKTFGIIMVLVSVFFLNIVPAITFSNYKRTIKGAYINGSGTKIIINESHEYVIISNGKQISKGHLEFSNIDSYSFYLDNDSQLRSTQYVDIISNENESDVYRRE